MRSFRALISGRGFSRSGPARPGARKARQLLTAPLVAVAGGSLGVMLLASTASAAPVAAATVVPAPQAGLTPGADSFASGEKFCACTIDMFYTGTDGSVVSQDVSAGTPVNAPDDLGGRLVTGPGPLFVPSGVLPAAGEAVFGEGTDGALWWTDPSAGQPWASLGGNITSKPSVITEGVGGVLGGITAFARGTDQAVWYTARTSRGWQAWTKLGGQLYPGTAPAAVYVGGTAYVVAVGADQQLYVNQTSDGARWSGWTLLGGKVSNAGGDPAVTAPTASTGVVFVRGTDNAVWYDQFAGSTPGVTPGFHPAGGSVTSGGAGATTDPNGGTHLFILGTGNVIQEASGVFPAFGSWTPEQ